MLYIERQPGKRSVALLIVLSALLYAGALCVFELRASDEGLQLAMAREMTATGEYVKTHLYGRPIREYPLYAWLVSLCSFLGMPSVWSLRLPAILSVIGLAAVSGSCARRLQSPFAGFIAAAVVAMCVASLRVGIRAQTEFLQGFLTFAAWWSWCRYGLIEKRWNEAWALSLLLVFAGILNAGLESVFWFYLPMLFMPRKINARGRMQMPAHIISAMVVLVLVFIWEWVTPDQPLMPWREEPGLGSSLLVQMGYFWHLVVFPWKMVCYLLPWSLFLWAPFCIALRQFERLQDPCRFFRIIITVIFLCVWFFPGTSPLHLLSLLGPVAVLIGVHFEIVIRRYQHMLKRVVQISAWLIGGFSIPCCLFWLTVAAGIVAMEDISVLRASVCAAALLAETVALWWVILRKDSRCTFKISIVLCIFAAQVLFLCSTDTYHQWRSCDRRLAGEMLACRRPVDYGPDADRQLPLNPVPPVKKIYYKPAKNNPNLYLAEFNRLQTPVVYVRPKLEWEKALPRDEKQVVVISTHCPVTPSWTWRPLSQPVDMKYRRVPCVEFFSWGDGLPLVRLYRKADSHGERPVMLLQLFEGTRIAQE